MKKSIYLFIITVITLLTVSSCNGDLKSTSDREMAIKTEFQMQEASKQIGVPAIVNFQEMKNLKWIYELCDQEDFICHAYLFNTMDGTVGQYLGECIGYGIPYSTQFSNPDKIVEADNYLGKNWNGLYPQVIAQPEPNGLFKPEGLSATWLIMIDPVTKKPRPIYIEPEIIVSPFKLK